MKVINKIFQSLGMTGSIFFNSKITSPWSIQPEEDGLPKFHIVLEGCTFVQLSDSVVMLNKGDGILVSGLESHCFSSVASNKVTESEPVVSPYCHLLCGTLSNNYQTKNPMFSSLPSVVILNSKNNSELSWVLSIGRLMDQEIGQTGFGSHVIVEKLCEIFFLHAFRYALNTQKIDAGFLRALADNKIRRVLEYIHDKPEETFDVNSLAEVAAMSRSAFAKRFNQLLGMPPSTYITMWRMNIAFNSLRSTNKSTTVIASEVGYSSDAGFARAFQREFGMTPLKVKSL